jgi:hypothetical protein
VDIVDNQYNILAKLGEPAGFSTPQTVLIVFLRNKVCMDDHRTLVETYKTKKFQMLVAVASDIKKRTLTAFVNTLRTATPIWLFSAMHLMCNLVRDELCQWAQNLRDSPDEPVFRIQRYTPARRDKFLADHCLQVKKLPSVTVTDRGAQYMLARPGELLLFPRLTLQGDIVFDPREVTLLVPTSKKECQ